VNQEKRGPRQNPEEREILYPVPYKISIGSGIQKERNSMSKRV